MQTPAVGIVFCLNLISFSCGLSLEKTYDSTDLPVTETIESTSAKNVEVKKNGFVFENGVLKVIDIDAEIEDVLEDQDSSPNSTTEAVEEEQEDYDDDDIQDIVFNDEAIQPLEMLTVEEEEEEVVNTTSPIFNNGNITVEDEEVVNTTSPIFNNGNITVEEEEVVNTTSPIFNNGNITVEHYHNYEMLQELATRLESQYPHLVSKYSIGDSVQGRQILALKIRYNVTEPRPLKTPMVKYVGNMHGDESVGREMIIALAQHLVYNYDSDDRIADIVNNTEIHLVPSMNPDGFEAVTRGNYNQVDLNRAFPGQELLDADREKLIENREPEVVAMINWILDNPWVVSLNLHDGAVVANYPWDQSNQQPWTKSDRFRDQNVAADNVETPDNDVFVMLSELYSEKHGTMRNQNHSCGSFERGITNGAEWYEISGGMQDFNYLYTNCLEITLELSCVKKPLAKMLQSEWENNREAMITYLEVAKKAVHGFVYDTNRQPVKDAHIQVVGSERDILTNENGEFWRLLTPGTHNIRAVKGNLMSRSYDVQTANNWRNAIAPYYDMILDTSVTSTTTKRTTTTASTTTTTEPEPEEGTNLYILPGVCVNLSFSFTPIRGCKQRNNG